MAAAILHGVGATTPLSSVNYNNSRRSLPGSGVSGFVCSTSVVLLFPLIVLRNLLDFPFPWVIALRYCSKLLLIQLFVAVWDDFDDSFSKILIVMLALVCVYAVLVFVFNQFYLLKCNYLDLVLMFPIFINIFQRGKELHLSFNAMGVCRLGRTSALTGRQSCQLMQLQ